MTPLYLIHQKGGQVLTFSPQLDGGWQMTRMPPQLLGKVHIVMCFGDHGWEIKEGNAKILPEVPFAEQDPTQPPLGGWRGASTGGFAGAWTLQDFKPESAPLPAWEPIVTPSISLSCQVVEEESLVRVDIAIKSKPLTDQLVEEVFRAMRMGVVELAKRPDMTMLFSLHLQDAPLPSMRHVKRLIALSHEIGDLLFLVARGSAMVLHPHGFFGNAMVGIIRLIQAAASAPWPETIVPSVEEADAFLENLRPSCLSPQSSGASPLKDINIASGHLTPANVEHSATSARPQDVKVNADWPALSKPCVSKPKPCGALACAEQESDDFDIDAWVPAEREEDERGPTLTELEMLPDCRERRRRSIFPMWQCFECV